MRCNNCGGELEYITTDLPFKVNQNSIIIIRKIPVLQCSNCREYIIEDKTMEVLDRRLSKVEKNVELEILSFA